jgi:hypothetical protein
MNGIAALFGIEIPKRVIPKFPHKECGEDSSFNTTHPRIVVKWEYQEDRPDVGVAIYRFDTSVSSDWFSWGLNSYWQVIDTILFGQYFYIWSDLTADHYAYYPETTWKDQFNGDIGTYNYFFRTFTTVYHPETNEKMIIYSDDDPDVSGVLYPVQEVYVNRELLNVCLAVTDTYYWPHSRNKIKATTEEK